MAKLEERIYKYLGENKIVEEAINGSNIIEKLLDFVMKLNVNKLPPEQAAELSSILNSIEGKDDGEDFFRINKSRFKMITKRFRRTSPGRRLDKKASKADFMEEM